MQNLVSRLSNTGQSAGKAVGGITSSIGKEVQVVGSSLSQNVARDTGHESQSGSVNDSKTTTVSPTATDTPSGGATGFTASILGPLKSGSVLSRDAVKDGFAIGQKVLQSGLDTGSNVVMGTASVAGTALGGVVAAAAEASGTVFEPVASGLKTIEGLDKLGQGLEAINGLPLGAVRQVSQLTMKALNMSEKTPTFFDPNADGIVTIADTIRGLILLGLEEKNATYGAYVLHLVFTYPTSDKWLPKLDKTLPIHVARMGRTSWGRNWGNFERVRWVQDVEVEKFFIKNEKKKGWLDYVKEGRQAFGALLLIFEWGTTWPFYIPDVPINEIPFAADIGSVVRKAILPTIFMNFKKANHADVPSKR